MSASLGLRDRTGNQIDKNVFLPGDYLLPMGEGVKMVLTLVERNRVGKKKMQLEMGGKFQLQFVIFNRGSGKVSLRSDIQIKA